jgi:hypothetical protein
MISDEYALELPVAAFMSYQTQLRSSQESTAVKAGRDLLEFNQKVSLNWQLLEGFGHDLGKILSEKLPTR